jgi:hypothetical protein
VDRIGLLGGDLRCGRSSGCGDCVDVGTAADKQRSKVSCRVQRLVHELHVGPSIHSHARTAMVTRHWEARKRPAGQSTETSPKQVVRGRIGTADLPLFKCDRRPGLSRLPLVMRRLGCADDRGQMPSLPSRLPSASSRSTLASRDAGALRLMLRALLSVLPLTWHDLEALAAAKRAGGRRTAATSEWRTSCEQPPTPG